MSSLPINLKSYTNIPFNPPITPIILSNLRNGYINLDRFKHFYIIENCFNVTISIKVKIAKVVIIGCKDVKINVDSPIIGTIDLIRLTNVNITINETVNIIQIDISSNIQIFQYIPEISYISCHSAEITVNGDPLPINEFSPQTCTIVNNNGIESINFTRSLNETEQFLFE